MLFLCRPFLRRWVRPAQRAVRRATAPQAARSELNRHEASHYSQNGEDGIIAFLFSTVGVRARIFCEIGIEDGRECNTANLALHEGWTGALFEKDRRLADKARTFHSKRPGVRVTAAEVRAENIDELLEASALPREIDLLSLDIDGNDYWVWKAISALSARVVVVEYNAYFGATRSVCIPYEPGFDRFHKHPSGFYLGASLTALSRLAGKKGYRLVGCDSSGVNAFFVREDVLGGALKEIAPEAAYYPLTQGLFPRTAPEAAFRRISHLPLVEV